MLFHASENMGMPGYEATALPKPLMFRYNIYGHCIECIEDFPVAYYGNSRGHEWDCGEYVINQ